MLLRRNGGNIMAVYKYDLDKLSDGGVMDAHAAVSLAYSYQDYYDLLTEFLADSPLFLCNYNPTVLVMDENLRGSFLNDCRKARAMLAKLGLNQAMDEVNKLEDAAYHDDVKLLTDGLVTFRATINIASDLIKAARV